MTAPTPPPMPPPPPGWGPQAAPSPYPAYQPGPAPRRPLWARWWLWAALAVVTVLVVGVVAAAAQHHSTLSADDQQFCSSLSDDPVATLRSDVDHLTANNHFASAGAAMAFDEVDLGTAGNVLSNANIQDAGLAQARDAVTSSMTDLSLGINSDSTGVNGHTLARVHDNLHALAGYCDSH